MRKIQFRVWDKEDKLMFTPTMIDFDNNEDGGDQAGHAWYQRSQCSDDGYWVQFPIFMQHTGIRNQEIYEGDIVEANLNLNSDNYIGQNLNVLKYRFIVEWHDYGYFSFRNITPKREKKYNPYEISYSHKRLVQDSIKVIGNIYQNPELV